MKKSELRKDYLLDRYVLIAPKRSKRPEQIKETAVVVSSTSPFSSIKKNKIIDSLGSGKYQITTVKNKYSAVSLQNPKAYGTQEVIIEFPDPVARLVEAPVEHFVNLFKMYGRRVQAVSKLKKIDYIICLKNEGAAAGASIQHEHSQLFASSFVSPLVQEEQRRLEEYHRTHHSYFYSDLIKKEMKTRRRVYEDKHLAVFTPYASICQYEVWFFTKRRVDNIAALNKQELNSLAKALKMVLTKLKKLGLAYNYFMRQVISNPHEHFCLKIQPRGSIWGGLEMDTGVIINPVPPEEAATYYRKG